MKNREEIKLKILKTITEMGDDASYDSIISALEEAKFSILHHANTQDIEVEKPIEGYR